MGILRNRITEHAPLTAVVTSVVLWASAFVGIRAAGESFSPGPLSLGRLLVALAALVFAAVIGKERLPSRNALRAAGPALLVCGVIWFGVYNLALNAAERRVDAGTAAMIVYISPILIAALAGVFLGEGFPPALFAGCAVAFAGVSVIGLANSGRSASTAGVLLCLVAAAALASGAVTQKVVLRHLSGLQTITSCCAIGVVVLLPFGGSLADELVRAPAGDLIWTIYLGIFPTAIGFLTWAYALSRTEAGRLGVTTYLVPAVSVVLAWLLLGETPRPLALLGGALCLTGVAVSGGLSHRRRRGVQRAAAESAETVVPAHREAAARSES